MVSLVSWGSWEEEISEIIDILANMGQEGKVGRFVGNCGDWIKLMNNILTIKVILLLQVVKVN